MTKPNQTAEEYLKDKQLSTPLFKIYKKEDVLKALQLKEQEVESLINLHNGDPDSCVSEILDLRKKVEQAKSQALKERGKEIEGEIDNLLGKWKRVDVPNDVYIQLYIFAETLKSKLKLGEKRE